MIQYLKCLFGKHERRGWNPTFSDSFPKEELHNYTQSNRCKHCNDVMRRNAKESIRGTDHGK